MEPLAKLSLYDILTQLISGFLILALFIPIQENGISQWIFVIIFSYLIGIIYHRLLEWFRSVKLEKWLMVISLFVPAIVVIIKQLQSILEVVIAFFIAVVIAFFIAAVITKCEKSKLFFLTIFCRNNKKVIAKANNGKCNTKKIKDEELSFIEKEYYDTYYSVMDKPAYGTISILEAQEAFLRNMTWVLVMYLIFYHSENKFFEGNLFAKIFFINPITDCNCLILITNIVIFLLPILFARYHTQMRVYKAVWEAGKYK